MPEMLDASLSGQAEFHDICIRASDIAGNCEDGSRGAVLEMMSKKFPLLAACMAAALLAAGCMPTPSSSALTPAAYAKAGGQKGVVLVSVNWGRAWGFCGFENVQLRSLGFDRLPIQKGDDATPADLVLEGPALLAEPISLDYALLLEPGEYALTAFHIKAAKSASDVGAFHAGRSKLMEGGKPLAGSFSVGANEIVYIGHFAPDCPQVGQPVIWRYYLKDAAAFKEYLAKMKAAYPFLEVEAAQFRLFQTTTIGQEFRLP